MTVGIVGAGLSGLSLAHFLRQRGVEVVAFEADDQPGGVIRSVEVDGHLLERGPQRMRLSPTVEPLVEELGLRDDLVTADDDLPLYVYADGKLREVPFSLGEFLRTDLLSWSGKARIFAEPLSGEARGEETVGGMFTRKFGREAYENFLGPIFGGTFGSDPREMPTRHALSGLMRIERRDGNLLKPALRRAMDRSESSPPITFEGGLQTLPRALYDANREAVRLETPVIGVGTAGDGYTLRTGDGTVAVDELVLTTPADVSATLLSDVATEAADRLRTLNYNPLAMVYLDAEDRREGFGYQIRHDEGFSTLGVSWNGSMFDRDTLCTCFLGGMKDPDLVEAPEDELARIAVAEFEEIMGFGADVVDVRRLRRGFPAYDRSWAALDDLALPDGLHLATNYTSRMGMPSRIREAKGMAESLAGT